MRQDEATSSGLAEKLDTMVETTDAMPPTSPLSPISPWPPLSDLKDAGSEPGDAPIGGPVNFQEPPAPERPGIGGDSMMDETLPTAKEVYGSLVVLLTSLGFILVLVWAFLPSRYLDYMGWTWYPDRWVTR
jgi:phosphatidylinositol glycan class P protein